MRANINLRVLRDIEHEANRRLDIVRAAFQVYRDAITSAQRAHDAALNSSPLGSSLSGRPMSRVAKRLADEMHSAEFEYAKLATQGVPQKTLNDFGTHLNLLRAAHEDSQEALVQYESADRLKIEWERTSAHWNEQATLLVACKQYAGAWA